MNIDLTTITDLIASNKELAAPAAALLVAWLLYGVLGKRMLGADDDFWPRIRRWLLPRLDSLADRTSGLYAEGRSHPREYAGFFSVRRSHLDDEDDPIDPVERDLETAGYTRNPLAAYKTSPNGIQSSGSWARRYGYIRGTGDILRYFSVNATRLPVDPRFLAGMLGRFLQGLGDILALRQVHVTLYVEEAGDDVVRVHAYVHDEPNSLNPLVALNHYHAVSQKAKKGVQSFQDDLSGTGIPFTEPNAN